MYCLYFRGEENLAATSPPPKQNWGVQHSRHSLYARIGQAGGKLFFVFRGDFRQLPRERAASAPRKELKSYISSSYKLFQQKISRGWCGN